MYDLKLLVFIALGAVCGALSRHFIASWLDPLFVHLNLGTLLANVCGCFIIGLTMAVLLQVPLSARVQGFFITGFLGSLTTFSSFAKEVVARYQNGQVIQALGVFVGHLFLGLSACVLALWLGNKLLKYFL